MSNLIRASDRTDALLLRCKEEGWGLEKLAEELTRLCLELEGAASVIRPSIGEGARGETPRGRTQIEQDVHEYKMFVETGSGSYPTPERYRELLEIESALPPPPVQADRAGVGEALEAFERLCGWIQDCGPRSCGACGTPNGNCDGDCMAVAYIARDMQAVRLAIRSPARGEDVVVSDPPKKHWRVEVSSGGESMVAIEPEMLAGRELDDEDLNIIRHCAEHLLAFAGNPNSAPAPEQGKGDA